MLVYFDVKVIDNNYYYFNYIYLYLNNKFIIKLYIFNYNYFNNIIIIILREFGIKWMAAIHLVLQKTH